MSDSLNPSGTGNEYAQPPSAGTQPEALDQSQSSGAYDQLQRSQGGDMGGGGAAAGSGVAGGYESHEQQSQPASAGQGQQQQQQTGEKQDWLDKGFESMGKKAGVNISDKNADTAGDFINKQFTSKAGRGIPGVQ